MDCSTYLGWSKSNKKGRMHVSLQCIVLVLERANSFDKLMTLLGFSGGSGGKESVCSAGDLSSIPGSGRSPGEGNGNSLRCSCLENPMDRGDWQAIVHRVAKNRTGLSD